MSLSVTRIAAASPLPQAMYQAATLAPPTLGPDLGAQAQAVGRDGSESGKVRPGEPPLSGIGGAEDAQAPADVTGGEVVRSAGQAESAHGPASKDRGAAGESAEGRQATAAFAEKGQDGAELDVRELAYLQQLRQADTAVRAHERAHLAAAGGLAVSGASYQYKRGPDGKNYAVAGEVGIDTSAESSPEATVAKMRKVRAAAMAPANPSPQDRRVAAQAAASITMAQAELRQIDRAEAEEARRQTVDAPADGPGGVGDRAMVAYAAASAQPAASSIGGGVNLRV